jgi:hypothetical protein
VEREYMYVFSPTAARSAVITFYRLSMLQRESLVCTIS